MSAPEERIPWQNEMGDAVVGLAMGLLMRYAFDAPSWAAVGVGYLTYQIVRLWDLAPICRDCRKPVPTRCQEHKR